MKLFLTGLFAWLLGLLTVLTVSTVRYEIPSIVDVTSFAVLLFAGSIILFVCVYTPILYVLRKKFNEQKVLKFTPILLPFVINVPFYVVLWWQSVKVCSAGEAFLFLLGFAVIAFVFGAGYSKIYRSKITSQTSG